MAKWIEFIEVDNPQKKTKKFEVFNKEYNVYLGKITWFSPFRKYSFYPSAECVFETTCLRDVADFLEKLMEERKAEKAIENKKAQMRKGFTC